MSDSRTTSRTAPAPRRPVDDPPVAAPPAGAPSRDTRRFLPLLPGLLMLAVALVGAGRPVLSWDEVTSAEVASRSVPQILDLIPNLDAVFGPYYLFLHFWTAVAGTGEIILRLPSIIAMAGAVTIAAELGRRLFDPAVGLVAGLLLCAVPNTSRYAAEARPYAFACFFAALAFLLLIVAVRRGGRLPWIWYGLSVLFLGLSHLIALTTLAAHLTYLVVNARDRVRVWAAAVGVALLPVLPIAYLGTTQEDTQLHWVAPITSGRIRDMPGEIVGSREVAWLLIGLAVLAVWRPGRRLVPIAVYALAPLTVVAVVSVLVSPMWVARYLLVVLAPLTLLAAVALLDGRSRHTLARAVVVLLAVAFVAIPGERAVRAATAKNGPDYRTIAKIIGAEAQPGDVVVYPARNRAIRAGTGYYLRRQSAAPADVLVEVPSAQTGWLIAYEYPDAVARLTGAPRIWLAVADRRDDPLTARPDLQSLITSGYHRIGLWQPKSATVALYAKN
ncbi:glycosyltransferase family 39 protein [Actinoplanes sichuanensis]|uniref:Glycosyltransferase family 39 protein n=1 Tax=Actinoplanes sichuanensis TaxID=512349 RepID=A0ABW4ASV0_9ACTN|nr:glycosyltransferase family 39 protein [Actinoplanes sichuanensis]